MNLFFTITGLVLATIGALILVLIDLNDRRGQASRKLHAANLIRLVKWHTKVLNEAVASIGEINANMGGQAYNEEKETAATRAKIDTLRGRLDEFTDPYENALNLFPGYGHLWGLLLLVVGFVCQVIGAILATTAA